MIRTGNILKELKHICFVITISIILVTLFTVLFVWIDVVETNDAILFIAKMYITSSYVMMSVALTIVVIKIIGLTNSGITRINQLMAYKPPDQ